MHKQIHHRPNLDHLRRQAKSLLSDLKAGNASAIEVIKKHLPVAMGMSSEQIQSKSFCLADAQTAIARSNGYASWSKLANYVEQLRLLEGTWEFLSLHIDGKQAPQESFESSCIQIDGDRFRMQSPEATYEGIFDINADSDPKQIDIEFVAGPEKGNWNYGIFSLRDDQLELCLDMHGQSRPDAFSTAVNSGWAHEVLRRVADTRPDSVQGGDAGEQDSAPTIDQPDSSDAYGFIPSKTLAKLQGKWKAESIVRDGKDLPGFMLKTAKRFAQDNEVTIKIGGRKIIHALVRIDESFTPIHVDYNNIGGKSKGTQQLGIMEWRGDVVWFCMAAPGQERPADFESPTGAMRTTSAWSQLA